MDPTDEYVIQLLESHRARIVKESTNITFAAGAVAMDRAGVEQLMNGVIALLEETLRGDSKDVREMYLESILPSLVAAGTTTWAEMLRTGLPCWGVILGKLVEAATPDRRDASIQRLSIIMGAWWRDVSNVVVPLYKARGEL